MDFIQKFYNDHYKEVGTNTSYRIEWYPILNSISRNSSVLDVACGDGKFGEILVSNKEVNIDGIEISTVAKEKAITRGYNEVFTEDLNDFDFSSLEKKYDHILLIDIVEHVFRPLDLIESALNKAKKSVFIATPNLGCFISRCQLLLGKYPSVVLFDEKWYNSGHIRLSTYDEMLTEIKNRGYKIESSDFIMPISSKKYLTSFDQEGKSVLFKSINQIYKIFVKIFPNLFSLIYIIEVKK